MYTEDPWPRPRNREINPLWIAVAILAALFIGYQLAKPRAPLKTEAAPQAMPPEPPAPVVLPTVTPSVAEMRARERAVEEQLREAARRAAQARDTGQYSTSAPPAYREIYLCKGYGGGMFWSSAICSTQRATIDRIVTVPANMPWDQQVQLAEGRRQEVQQLYAQPRSVPLDAGNASPGSARPAECQALEMRIQQLDSMARQPQSGYTQDWIRNERQQTRSRQAALRC